MDSVETGLVAGLKLLDLAPPGRQHQERDVRALLLSDSSCSDRRAISK